MKIFIIRHGTVNYKWNKWCTSAQFEHDCRGYDSADIFKESYPAPDEEIARYYVSTLPRTLATARNIFGEKDYIVSDLIYEVPITPFVDSKIKLPLSFWNVIGRIQWMLNCSRQEERRSDTVKRADKFLDILIERNENCAVVTHGFFMLTLIKEARKKGFTIQNASIDYKNGACVTAIYDS